MRAVVGRDGRALRQCAPMTPELPSRRPHNDDDRRLGVLRRNDGARITARSVGKPLREIAGKVPLLGSRNLHADANVRTTAQKGPGARC